MKQLITIDPFLVSSSVTTMSLRRGEEVDIKVLFSSSNSMMPEFTLVDKVLDFYWAPMQYAATGQYWHKQSAVSFETSVSALVHFDTNTMATDAADFLCFIKVSNENEVAYRGVFSISIYASPGAIPAILDIPSSPAENILLPPTDNSGLYTWDSSTENWTPFPSIYSQGLLNTETEVEVLMLEQNITLPNNNDAFHVVIANVNPLGVILNSITMPSSMRSLSEIRIRITITDTNTAFRVANSLSGDDVFTANTDTQMPDVHILLEPLAGTSLAYATIIAPTLNLAGTGLMDIIYT